MPNQSRTSAAALTNTALYWETHLWTFSCLVFPLSLLPLRHCGRVQFDCLGAGHAAEEAARPTSHPATHTSLTTQMDRVRKRIGLPLSQNRN